MGGNYRTVLKIKVLKKKRRGISNIVINNENMLNEKEKCKALWYKEICPEGRNM